MEQFITLSLEENCHVLHRPTLSYPMRTLNLQVWMDHLCHVCSAQNEILDTDKHAVY